MLPTEENFSDITSFTFPLKWSHISFCVKYLPSDGDPFWKDTHLPGLWLWLVPLPIFAGCRKRDQQSASYPYSKGSDKIYKKNKSMTNYRLEHESPETYMLTTATKESKGTGERDRVTKKVIVMKSFHGLGNQRKATRFWSTRETRWCQIRCSRTNSSKIIGRKRKFWKIVLDPSI